MSNSKFRSALFGYNKKDIFTYIEELTQLFESTIKEKDTKLTALTNENAQLKAKLSDAQADSKMIDDAKRHMGEAIIKAEQQSRRIIEEAHILFDTKRENIERQVEERKLELAQAKKELAAFRASTLEVMHLVSEKLITLIDQEDAKAAPSNMEAQAYPTEAQAPIDTPDKTYAPYTPPADVENERPRQSFNFFEDDEEETVDEMFDMEEKVAVNDSSRGIYILKD
ncbi:MAG: hypothetical protein H7Y41_06795 [Hyphomonadaceae bacterium]|nr:hypothetical protein [Clostridia bacterium]